MKKTAPGQRGGATTQVSELLREPKAVETKKKLKTKSLIWRNAVILGSQNKNPERGV